MPTSEQWEVDENLFLDMFKVKKKKKKKGLSFVCMLENRIFKILGLVLN